MKRRNHRHQLAKMTMQQRAKRKIKRLTRKKFGSESMILDGDVKSHCTKIPLWIRFLLLFKKTYTTYDPSAGVDMGCRMKFKKLFGKTYIIDALYMTTYSEAEKEFGLSPALQAVKDGKEFNIQMKSSLQEKQEG